MKNNSDGKLNSELKLENIHFKYKTDPVIRDITVNFGKGVLYGIMGPNGCGKTTLLNLISKILKNQYGKIVIDGKSISDLSIREIAKNIAYVKQKNSLEFDFSVKEIILMGRYAYIDRFYQESEEDKRIVDEILKKMGLKPFEDRNYSTLSGGEQQKVLVAQAMAQKGKILLLDEPTSHLDINFQIELMEILKNLVSEGIVVISVLHDINLATQYCDKILLIKNGKIHSFGIVSETITQQNIREVFDIDVVVGKNLYTNTIYITPLRAKQLSENSMNNNNQIKVHIIAGGGSALKILPEVTHFKVSVGIVNILDDDHRLSEDLNYEVISEPPFSPISEDSKKKLRKKINSVDYVILPSIPFGKANISNLELLLECKKDILITEKSSMESRDFTPDKKAIQIYSTLIQMSNVRVFHKEKELIDALLKLTNLNGKNDER